MAIHKTVAGTFEVDYSYQENGKRKRKLKTFDTKHVIKKGFRRSMPAPR
jgi:hypothetical protein